jgi:3-hydroxyacyl-CoA dehydrogenase
MGATVSVRTERQVAILVIEHPPVNALAQPVRAALLEAVERADRDSSVVAIVITGTGRTFVAGAEIRELDDPPLAPVLVDVLARIESCGKPVIAAISGFALGGDPVTADRAAGSGLVDRVVAATQVPFKEGIASSRRLFEECRVSDASRALRHLFFAERAAGAVAAAPRPIRQVAVIGAGTMGVGIAIALADAGLESRVIDPDPTALERGRNRFETHYASQVQRGRCDERSAAERLARTAFEAGLDAAAGCDLAIEAVVEDLAVKREVFAALDRSLPDGALMASNTSYLDIDQLAAATDEAALATGAALARRLRKIPVIVGNATGFVGNRMLQAYGRESQLLLLEGATPQQVDAALEAWGMAMGPCAVFDLAGLDVGYRARRQRRDLPDDPRYFRVADRLVELGRLGRKSGSGHYRYGEGGERLADPEALRIIEAEARALGVERRDIDDAQIVERCIAALVVEGRGLVASGIAASPADIDTVWVNGYGFPRFRGGPMYYASRRAEPLNEGP